MSMKLVTFPCIIARHECNITTDVVNSSIPPLLSVGSMKKLQMLWDLAKGEARILGRWTDLIQMSVGHYGIEINASKITKDGIEVKKTNENSLEKLEICLINLLDEGDDEKLEKQLRHLHRQFGHPSQKRWELFMKLCKDNSWTQKKKEVMERYIGLVVHAKFSKRLLPKQ